MATFATFDFFMAFTYEKSGRMKVCLG